MIQYTVQCTGTRHGTSAVPKIIWISANTMMVKAGEFSAGYVWLCSYVVVYHGTKTSIYRCICSNRVRFGFFAEIPNFWGYSSEEQHLIQDWTTRLLISKGLNWKVLKVTVSKVRPEGKILYEMLYGNVNKTRLSFMVPPL